MAKVPAELLLAKMRMVAPQGHPAVEEAIIGWLLWCGMVMKDGGFFSGSWRCWLIVAVDFV